MGFTGYWISVLIDFAIQIFALPVCAVWVNCVCVFARKATNSISWKCCLPAECGLWVNCGCGGAQRLAVDNWPDPGVKFGLKRLKGCNAGESEAFTGFINFSFDGFLRKNKLISCSDSNP